MSTRTFFDYYGHVKPPAAFAVLDASVAAERERLASSAQAVQRSELANLAFEEIVASCAQAGAALEPHAMRALLERGLALGDRPLRDYLIASGYAAAAQLVHSAEPPRAGEPLLRQEEIVELHARATRLLPDARPGAWRITTSAALRSGMVPPPFWLVPREVAGYVDRFSSPPSERGSSMVFIADAHERFTRIHPFSAGNGRVARLVTNLLLRRLGYPPFFVRRTQLARYRAALARADARDPWPLAAFVARSILAGLGRLASAGDAASLRPLTEFVGAYGREALYKAAQRGRLRTVRKGRALFTTEAWLGDYLGGASRSRPKV